jgi:methanethiol S-methyltransferase
MWQSVLVLVLYIVLYSLAHSLMAAASFKRWGRRRYGRGFERGYRLLYNLVALLALLPLPVLLVRLPDRLLYTVAFPWNGLMVAGQALALILLLISLLQTNLLHFAGIAQLLAGKPEKNGELVVRGLYGHVRHPLYLFSILLLWLTPAMTANLFTCYLFFTLYFFLGSIHEERRLQHEFGAQYRAYRQQVPSFLPWPGRHWRSGD